MALLSIHKRGDDEEAEDIRDFLNEMETFLSQTAADQEAKHQPALLGPAPSLCYSDLAGSRQPSRVVDLSTLKTPRLVTVLRGLNVSRLN